MTTGFPSRLAVPNFQSGMAFLSRLPLNNVNVAYPSLAEFLESLIESPPPFQVFVQLLEQCRIPLAHLQAEVARTYLEHAIPLGESEEAVFQQVIRGWQRMARAYARCAQLDHGDDAEHATRVAAILQRCIRYSGMAILEHFRVRRELAPGLWLDFFGYYDTAEEWGIAKLPVQEPFDRVRHSSYCAAELVAVLLVDLAGPFSYSVKDLDLITEWARLWSPLVGVHSISPGDATPQYLIDLMKDGGIRMSRQEPHSEGARQLDTSRLSIQVEQTRMKLEEKQLPSQLGLGDCMSNLAKRLLADLSRPWAQVSSPRRFRRRPAQGTALLATSFENIHYLLLGKDFSQPSDGNIYSRKEFELLYAFRHQTDPSRRLYVENPERDVPADTWGILNESANGFRLARRIAGQRVAHKQLLAVRPTDGDRFVLAQAHWLMQERDGGLVAGIEVLHGTPEPVAVRRVVQNQRATPGRDPNFESFNIAFMLPEISSMQSPASLILPVNWYQPRQEVEMYTTTSWRIRLTGLMQRGADFDRVSFIMAG